ncbi:MAG: glycogen debranching protein, partial [Bacteroidota bacterium]
RLSEDISDRPSYSSDQPIVDALFNLSLEEAIKNIEPDSTLRTGAKWGGVWTRDVSYSTLLAFAYHEPEVAKISLRKKVKRGRIIQDTGSGGAWPVSSDRTTWCLAAWEIYKVTGDQAWLDEVYPIIKNTLEDDYKTIYDAHTGMYSGESSFLDWREQTYPKWMDNRDIYVSQNLGTNVVHYQAHQILAEMAKLKGEPYQLYQERATTIKQGINDYLWLGDKGYYAQFLYGRDNMIVSSRHEALGEALAILFGVADKEKAAAIIAKSPLTEFGATCIYPQIPGIPPYHNNGIWPFVQSYWNWAAAKTGNEEVLVHGLASVYRAAALFLSNYENMVAETGDFLGTEINSHRMLWSMAGNLAMVHRVFIGMDFQQDGLYFNPVVPKVYSGERTLSNFKYRGAVLNITVKGFGNTIKKTTINGKSANSAFIPTDAVGEQHIVIELANNNFPQNDINKVDNHFTLPTVLAEKNGNNLNW